MGGWLKFWCVVSFILSNTFSSLSFSSEAASLPTSSRKPWWSLDLPKEPDRPRSDVIAPLVSLMIPSFDQFYEGQTTAGGLYLTYSLLGLSQMAGTPVATEDSEKIFSQKDDHMRRYFLGAQMIQTAGSLSAFHSFRSAVESRRSLGEYGFLIIKEDSADLLKAPFRFDFLTRTSTWAILGLEVLALAIDFNHFEGKTQFTNADAGFTAAYSYQAGIGEEALFRGWLMPTLTNSGWSPWASNLFTATTFSLAHLSSSNKAPWPQFLLGYYLGQVALWNEWSIQESVFIHTWWDVLAIGATWAVADANKEKSIFVPLIDRPISL